MTENAMQNRGFWMFALIVLGALGLLAWRYPYIMGKQDTLMNLIYSVLLFLLIAPGLFSRYQHGNATWVKHLSLWAAIMLLLLAGYAYRHELLDNRIIASLIPRQAHVTDRGTVEIAMGQDGHFHIEVEINGSMVSFLVDTGASDIVLSPADAARIGFEPSQLDYTRVYSTANGFGKGAPVTLNLLRVGNIEMSGIEASVNDAEMDHSLLGMRFFRQLRGFSVEGDRMVLTP